MQIEHCVTMLFLGVNITLLLKTALGYTPIVRRKVPGLVYCLALLLASILLSATVTMMYMLTHVGPLLDVLAIVMSYASIAINALFVLMISRVTRASGISHNRLRNILFALLAVFALLLATNPAHGLLITSVQKAGDGFLFDVIYGPLRIVVRIYSTVLYVMAVYMAVRSDNKSVIQSNTLRWLLALLAVLPPLFEALQMIVPALKAIAFACFMSWIPNVAITHLFFGYLRSSRPTAIEDMEDGYVVFDLHGVCVDINSRALLFFRRFCEVERPDIGHLRKLLQLDDISGEVHNEVELKRGNRLRYYRISSFRLSSGIVRHCGYGFMIKEITEYRQHMIELSDIASQDPLTGVRNRRFLDENAPRIVSKTAGENMPLSVLMLDIDYFKKVNDTYGHKAGDEVLIKLCDILRSNTRESDLIIRYGGEEFIVVCAGITCDSVVRLAERIRAAVEEHHFETRVSTLRTSVSIGVCCALPGEVDELDSLIVVADECLYEAKNSGRNMVVSKRMSEVDSKK